MNRPAWLTPLVLLAACDRAAPDPRGVDRNETLLQVTADGEAEVRPDEARFSVGVSSIAPTAAEVTAANNRKMNAVVEALKRQGIAEADMQTRQLTIGRIGYGPNRGRFEANNVLNVRVRQVGRAGEAIVAATGAGANVLSGPDLRVGDPERAGSAARAAAFRNARTRADAYAGAAGLRIARVLAIRDGGAARPPSPSYDMAVEAQAAPAPVATPPVLAGTDTRTATVSVDFALVPR
ncbi:SIMPL domain-containing protein [Sphingomonas lenta]|uniref:SIMPL domain-containing protein n=1 Tax=Sphingomonas lenta TaxID=1141887 RepID=A0A2A2SJ86_9SPHN|nr:SIMPL domain-containing protein [Sphingomonas lenta]PAX09293.1 hypothetical protein CKY28_00585 [Sphingomonas lenta]